ncbi:MAG: alanine racemase [Oceanivirga sp.]|nr:alanine racemase [Oceanivirga sp.]
MKSYIEIDLKKIEENTIELTNKIGKEKIIAVLKADAYGLGYKEVFKKLLSLGIKYYAVGTLEEAFELYDINKSVRILILCPFENVDYEKIKNTNIEITVTNEDSLKYLLKNNIKNNIHIKFDTGMNRLGFKKENIHLIDKYVDKLNIVGIFTHLSSVTTNEEYTLKQIDIFNEYTKKCSLKKHILNSDGVSKYYKDKNKVLDYVRVGIYLFKNSISFYTKVCNVYEFNEKYYAVLNVGYLDGYAKKFSNNARVYIKNNYYNVTDIDMYYTVILADKNVNIGDKVELFGKHIEINEEYMTGFSDKLEKIYKGI